MKVQVVVIVPTERKLDVAGFGADFIEAARQGSGIGTNGGTGWRTISVCVIGRGVHDGLHRSIGQPGPMHETDGAFSVRAAGRAWCGVIAEMLAIWRCEVAPKVEQID